MASHTRGVLLEPGLATGRSWRIRFSPIAEHFWSEGALGADLWTQLQRGPCRWQMLFSCVGFAIPALVHLGMHQHLADYIAAIALLCVAVSSPLCDAFCVDSCIYDDGRVLEADGMPYARTGACIGKDPEWISRNIQETEASPEILANDQWNNLSRLIDRATCVFIVLPSIAFFVVRQRPQMLSNLPFVGGFFVAWGICFLDQKYRYVDPCGTRFVNGKWLTERSYEIHQRLHEVWHYILIVTLTCSALYRP
mmetsp:Transcript_106123/g.342644  ORF Transcript_106123/g.342644 Transcript_106123/m.342644 type:complete len:252 (+) Transcript_106123:142-897(+)